MCLSISVRVSPIEGKLIHFLLRFYSFLFKISGNKVVCFRHFCGHFSNISSLSFFPINFFYVLYFSKSKPMRLFLKSYILIQWVKTNSDKIVYFCGIFCFDSSNVCQFSLLFFNLSHNECKPMRLLSKSKVIFWWIKTISDKIVCFLALSCMF